MTQLKSIHNKRRQTVKKTKVIYKHPIINQKLIYNKNNVIIIDDSLEKVFFKNNNYFIADKYNIYDKEYQNQIKLDKIYNYLLNYIGKNSKKKVIYKETTYSSLEELNKPFDNELKKDFEEDHNII